MKNKTLLFIVALMLSSLSVQKVNAQWVVSDPIHTGFTEAGWIAEAISWATQMSQMIDDLKIKEKLQSVKYLKDLESLAELAKLVDDFACLSSEYRFYMNLGGHYHCLKFLNHQQVTVNLKLGTDLLFKVATITDFFSMNSEGRMSFVGQVREAFEAASAQMKSFNEAVRSDIIKESTQKHIGKTYYSGKLSAFTRYTN